MAPISAAFFVSTVLNCNVSSASSPPPAGAGTRAARSPVSTMRRAVSVTARSGRVARHARPTPASAAARSVPPPTHKNVRRSGARSVARLSVLRAT